MDKHLFFWRDFHIDFSRSVLLAAGVKYEAPFTEGLNGVVAFTVIG